MTKVRVFSMESLDRLSAEASASPRRRKNLNVHPVLTDPVQRLFNGMEPGTYVRPHRHPRAEGWELMLAARGSFAILTFDTHGTVLERIHVSARGGSEAAEIPSYVWHAVVSLESGTVMFEVKPGPYSPLEDKDFAPWAPLEGEPQAAHFVTWYETARPGDRPPG